MRTKTLKMEKLAKVYMIILLCTLPTMIMAHDAMPDTIDNTMRGIGIKYLISKDRKLPKENRQKWEADLAEYIDFDSLNEGMRNRIKTAVAKTDPGAIDDENTAHLAEKAVLFLLPRQLADYTRVYLQKKDEMGELGSCEMVRDDIPADDFIMCLKALSENEHHVVFMAGDSADQLSLVFKKGARWQLVNIESEIKERTLLTVAMWK